MTYCRPDYRGWSVREHDSRYSAFEIGTERRSGDGLSGKTLAELKGLIDKKVDMPRKSHSGSRSPRAIDGAKRWGSDEARS